MQALYYKVVLGSALCKLCSTKLYWELHLISKHVSSSQLFSSYPISSHISFKKKFNCFHLIRALINLSHLLEIVLNSSQLFCTPESSYCQREVSCTKKHWAQKVFAHRHLRHRCIYIQKPFRNTLYTTKLAQSTSQYHFVLQSLHKALPSTTLYYKACTKHVPVLLCNTKLAQNTFQYYYVLQSLHKALWSAKCKCEVWSVKCEECSVKCPGSFRLVLHCAGVARRSCSWTTSV